GEVTRDARGLLDERGEVHVQRKRERLFERAEEVVVVVGNDELRIEAPEEALDVALGEAAPGDAGEEGVDAAARDLVVDQVAAPLVIEDLAADLDADAEDLAAAEAARAEMLGVLARDLVVVG